MSVRRGGKPIATGSESHIDLVVIGEETLRLSQRLEPASDLLPFSGRLVRNFNAIVETLMCTMIGIRRHRPDCNPIAAQLVRCQNPRLTVLLGETPEEALRGPCIAALLDKNVEHVAIGVYGPPNQCASPLIWITTSSRCHLSSGTGRSRRMQAAK